MILIYFSSDFILFKRKHNVALSNELLLDIDKRKVNLNFFNIATFNHYIKQGMILLIFIKCKMIGSLSYQMRITNIESIDRQV